MLRMSSIEMPFQGDLVLSVVSHGHGSQVRQLLADLSQVEGGLISRVVLTLNVPEPMLAALSEECFPFVLEVRRNELPLGFGRNHNEALQDVPEGYVCLLNPDVRLEDSQLFYWLAMYAAKPGVGCAYPVQVNELGVMQDSERELPTPTALWRRRVLGKKESRVDWVNAACMVLPREAWVAVGGFDERYFMYCEDVDLCLRLRQAGYSLVRAPVQIVHAGQRASRRRWEHLRWHVASLLRLWRSPAYRWACNALPAAGAGADNIGAS